MFMEQEREHRLNNEFHYYMNLLKIVLYTTNKHKDFWTGRQEQCHCDLFHMQRLLQHQEDTGDEITTGSAGACVANPPATGGNTIGCCGQNFMYKLYNVADKQCINVNGNYVVASLI